MNGVLSQRAEGIDSWATLVNESFVPLEVSAHASEMFRAQIRSRSVGEIHFCDIAANPHSVERTEALVRQGAQKYYKVSLQLSGTGLLIQDNREAVLRPGDIAIYDTSRPYSLTFDKEFQSLVTVIPQASFDLSREAVGQLTAVRLASTNGVAKVVSPFLASIGRNLEDMSGHTGLRLVHNAVELLSTLVHSELSSSHADFSLSHRANLLQEIRSYIESNLGDSSLSPNSIAAANFISTRHLHGIFSEEGITVSAWIRNRRLELCQRDLADPLLAQLPVSSIAMRWGFLDASHFSRLFKSTFDEAPTDFRNRCMSEIAK
ncbi:MAG: helix-turn-helix domain-containing protein [Microbacteriaceae bacterium]